MKKIAVLLAFLLCLSGCTSAPRQEPETGQAITLTGLPEEVRLTEKEVKALPIIETEAFTRDSKNRERTNRVKGALLDDVLSAYGKRQADFTAITALSEDGYQVSIPNDILVSRQVIIVYEMDGWQIPLRLCVPEERTMYWVKNLSALAFSGGQEPQACTRVIILETAVASLSKVDFAYNANVDKAVRVSDLAAKYLTQPDAFVYIKARDGLSPTTTYEAFVSDLLKLDGDAAPLLGRPESFGAMSIKGFRYALCGDTALYFAGGETTMQAILEELAIPLRGSFILTDEGGQAITITAGQAADFVITISEDGTAEGNGMKKLLSIEVGS